MQNDIPNMLFLFELEINPKSDSGDLKKKHKPNKQTKNSNPFGLCPSWQLNYTLKGNFCSKYWLIHAVLKISNSVYMRFKLSLLPHIPAQIKEWDLAISCGQKKNIWFFSFLLFLFFFSPQERKFQKPSEEKLNSFAFLIGDNWGRTTYGL